MKFFKFCYTVLTLLCAFLTVVSVIVAVTSFIGGNYVAFWNSICTAVIGIALILCGMSAIYDCYDSNEE